MRVVLADDSVLLREGIARILAEAGMEVVGQASDGDELLRKVRGHKPDVAVVDIRMPPDFVDEGLQAARRIRSEMPDTGVLILSQYAEEHFAMSLLSEGAEGMGYLLKDRVGEIERFVDAVRRVAEGGSALDPEVVALMVGKRGSDGPMNRLSPRERDAMELMAEGLSNRAIAEKLVVTERAVERHITSIFGKLDLPATGEQHRRVLAVLRYLDA